MSVTFANNTLTFSLTKTRKVTLSGPGTDRKFRNNETIPGVSATYNLLTVKRKHKHKFTQNHTFSRDAVITVTGPIQSAFMFRDNAGGESAEAVVLAMEAGGSGSENASPDDESNESA